MRNQKMTRRLFVEKTMAGTTLMTVVGPSSVGLASTSAQGGNVAITEGVSYTVVTPSDISVVQNQLITWQAGEEDVTVTIYQSNILCHPFSGAPIAAGSYTISAKDSKTAKVCGSPGVYEYDAEVKSKPVSVPPRIFVS